MQAPITVNASATRTKNIGGKTMPTDVQASAKTRGATVVLGVPTRVQKRRVSGKTPKRLHAKAIKRILDRQSGELVGWLYEWNTGEVVPRWKAGAQSNVIYD